jgi:two-component system, OmpR family, sensor histidine kinase SenX3
MDVAAIAGGVVVGLLVGVWAGRRTRNRDIRRLDAERRRTDGVLEDRAKASAEATQVRDKILGSMQDGVMLFDGGWRTVFANQAIERHLGERPEALVQIFPPSLRETIRRVAETEHVEVAEIETGAPTRWLQVTATPTGADGSVLAVIADVTEARRLDAIRRDFVANASHELKTPAASIQAAAETLLHVWREDPEAVPRFAEQLEREAVRLSRIVADLLDLSRLESGSELQDQVHLDALVREETSRLEVAAMDAGLTVDVEAATVPAVRGSTRDLSLLVRNLLDNAIRYTKAGTVVASVSATEEAVVLRVSDTGTGIPSKELGRVFERFYRVDRARSRETGGTGLGLAIVRHVAENHGGTVTVESELGRGSTFEVRLPSAIGEGTGTDRG